MNLRYETNTGGSASEVIRPTYGVDDGEVEDREGNKEDGVERKDEQEGI